MHVAFLQEVNRVNPFRIETLPWILKVYRQPFNRWPSAARQALFGAPNLLLFFLHQRLWPLRPQAHVEYTCKGLQKRIQINSKNSQYRALYLNAFSLGYEPQTTALIHLLVPDDGVLYDIGSNWGWFSLSLASRPGFCGKIHAFEPFASSYADLCSVVGQAGLGETVQCHNVALADRCGTGAMRLPDYVQSGLAVLEEDSAAAGKGTAMVTLDSLKIEPPSFMKVDVEGGEAKVFRGGSKLIATHKPMIVFENSRSLESTVDSLQPIQFLQQLDYVFFRMAWLKRAEGVQYFVGDDQESQPRPAETLALLQFDPAERFLLPDSLNIFACHRDKIAALEQKFRKA